MWKSAQSSTWRAMFICPISFYTGAALEWFVEWALLGSDWLLVGAIKDLCCWNCISVLIITAGVIIDCFELFRVDGRVTVSKLSWLECRYHYALSFVICNETMISILFPHLIRENILFKNGFILSHTYYWAFAFVHLNAQPTSILSFRYTYVNNILEDGQFIHMVLYH